MWMATISDITTVISIEMFYFIFIFLVTYFCFSQKHFAHILDILVITQPQIFWLMIGVIGRWSLGQLSSAVWSLGRLFQ